MEMEMEMLAAILSMVLVFSLFPLFLWRRYRISRSTEEHEERQIDQVPDINVPGRQPGTRRMRRRHVGSSSSTAVEPEEIQEEDAEPGSDYYVAKASKKKEMKKQEREARRQAEEGAREMRQTKQDRYDEIRRRKDEEREAEELKKEEEALARKAKEEEAANAEFEKWKDAFTVEKEGTEEENQDAGQGMLSDFVEYIKMQKCVQLEDLAGEFKLRTQDCINRISALEKMGRLSGVMDDRGKYIYISLEEMKAVADYIKRQGRVSISHLASKSNEFIKLEPIIDVTTSTCSSDYIVENNEHDVILVS